MKIYRYHPHLKIFISAVFLILLWYPSSVTYGANSGIHEKDSRENSLIRKLFAKIVAVKKHTIPQGDSKLDITPISMPSQIVLGNLLEISHNDIPGPLLEKAKTILSTSAGTSNTVLDIFSDYGNTYNCKKQLFKSIANTPLDRLPYVINGAILLMLPREMTTIGIEILFTGLNSIPVKNFWEYIEIAFPHLEKLECGIEMGWYLSALSRMDMKDFKQMMISETFDISAISLDHIRLI